MIILIILIIVMDRAILAAAYLTIFLVIHGTGLSVVQVLILTIVICPEAVGVLNTCQILAEAVVLPERRSAMATVGHAHPERYAAPQAETLMSAADQV